MHERGLPGQGSRATRFQVLENTGYLGVSSHYWVCQEKSINKRPCIELTVSPNCEPLSSQTLVFNTLICLSDHQESVPNSTKVGVPDSKDHQALSVLTERCEG